MITKAKKLTYTASNGTVCDTLEGVKLIELSLLCDLEHGPETPAQLANALVAKPREAIAILKFGLPRKPRTTKPPMGRKPRRNLKREMPEIPGV